MTRPTRQELEAMRREGLSADVREQFRAAESCADAWSADHQPNRGLAEALDWIDALRRVFGDPPPDRSPWRGRDFRL
jgi:hypothetical protein